MPKPRREPITTDEFTLRLAEHIQSIWFSLLDPDIQAGFKEMLGVDEDAVIAAIDPPNLDMVEVSNIARYLIEDEELGNEELTLLLTIGLFIHGYQHRNDPL